MKDKKKKKKSTDVEKMTAEEAFGFHFIAGYTENGVPYGITLEEANEQGLLDDADTYSSNDSDLPF